MVPALPEASTKVAEDGEACGEKARGRIAAPRISRLFRRA
eukprot:CAMPEP_0174736876 /NCGR_PEP_ID=MMETSP1094-20130205/67433_1 /TAXON_ID=156173 /ORGANISM="Chrysochromulina brevifilum, Strain UTEX LB 985" /LENGTH=39 /DNA_ID= /DNA_START= /DNA_END= /DNA_ORIENTATION=